jgi:hypothetical protein
MPEFIKDSKLKHCEISGAIYEGLTITTPDGKKGRDRGWPRRRGRGVEGVDRVLSKPFER